MKSGCLTITLFVSFTTVICFYSGNAEITKTASPLKNEYLDKRMCKMEVDELKNKLARADREAVSMVDTISDKEGAMSVIRTFLSDNNPEVRLVAVECLTIIDHPESNKLFVMMCLCWISEKELLPGINL